MIRVDKHGQNRKDLRFFKLQPHCNTLQHTAAHCNTLQHAARHCNTLQDTATHCNTLQHAATHCNTLQHTATHCNQTATKLQDAFATHCNTLQHTATHCNTLQHTATLCSTPQPNCNHTATRICVRDVAFRLFDKNQSMSIGLF